MKNLPLWLVLAFCVAGGPVADSARAAAGNETPQADLYRMQRIETRWSSFENPTGAKGQAATLNRGAKGNAFKRLKAGESKVLLDVKGPGVIRRVWLTIMDKSPTTCSPSTGITSPTPSSSSTIAG